jgi:hypothetical protein
MCSPQQPTCTASKPASRCINNGLHLKISVTDDFHIRTVHLDIIKVIYSPTDAQVNCLKNNIKIYIKTAPTCFGAVTPSSGSALSVLAKVTLC